MSEPVRSYSLLSPRIALPFLLVSIIWGSTWWVILGQLEGMAPSWSVALRFLIATPAMFIVALALGNSLALDRAGHGLAIAVGLFQFCLNFNMVYRSELYLTSGIVAVMFGLLIVPNSLLGRALLGQKLTARFMIGSVVAISGIALLLIHEAREASMARAMSGFDIGMGIFWGVGGMLAASIANVIQAGETGRKIAMASLIAWAMLYGTVFDVTLAWALDGPLTLPPSGGFWIGLTYLALAGSVVTFPLYYQLVREMGAGRAAYHAVLVVIIAMALSTLLEGYRWTALSMAGAALALAGMLLALRARSN